MAIPELDPRLDLLVDIFTEAGRRIQRLLDNLLDETQQARRVVIFQQIANILDNLKKDASKWGIKHIEDFYREYDEKALEGLRALQIDIPDFGATINTGAVQAIARHLSDRVNDATESIRNLSARVFTSTALERTFPELAFQVEREVAIGLAGAERISEVRSRIAGRLRNQFADGVVSIRTRTGKTMNFPLNYYAAMVAQNTQAQAYTQAMLNRAGESGYDLVQVSANRSTTKDYCDEYAGKVFSISGTDPNFPPLNGTPNGGPPFHPWCKHALGIFVPDFYTDEEIQQKAVVDDRFLLQPGETSVNRIAREWWAQQREN